VTDTDDAGLTIVLPPVLSIEGQPGEYFGRVGEIKTSILEGLVTFGRIERDLHQILRIYKNAVPVKIIVDTKNWCRHDGVADDMRFAHLKRILRLGRLRLRGPCGAQFEFTLAAIAQNLRRLAKLVAQPPPAVAAWVTRAALRVRPGQDGPARAPA
jgi:hypothetical protein